MSPQSSIGSSCSEKDRALQESSTWKRWAFITITVTITDTITDNITGTITVTKDAPKGSLDWSGEQKGLFLSFDLKIVTVGSSPLSLPKLTYIGFLSGASSENRLMWQIWLLHPSITHNNPILLGIKRWKFIFPLVRDLYFLLRFNLEIEGQVNWTMSTWTIKTDKSS